MASRSKSRSKQESVTGASTTQTIAANAILESLLPGSTQAGTGYVQQPSQQMQTQTGLPYEGPGGTPQGQAVGSRATDASKEGYGVKQGRDIMSQFLSTVPAYSSSLPGDSNRMVTQSPTGLEAGQEALNIPDLMTLLM